MPLDPTAARDFATWQRLAPSLHLCDAAFWAAHPPAETSEDWLAALGAQFARESYFQTEPLDWALPVDAIGGTVTRLRQAGIPLPFAFVYDEPWLMLRRLGRVIAKLLGPDYRLIPDCMAWHVDPRAGEAGWLPHRDRGRASLHPDGRPRILTLWLPLTDATPLNGCIYVVPADRDPTYNTPDENTLAFALTDIRALPARAGSVLGWTQALLHWGSRTAPRDVAPRISLGAECQLADDEAFGEPLLDPAAMPDLPTRLDVIAQSILRHAHHGGATEPSLALARALLREPRQASRESSVDTSTR